MRHDAHYVESLTSYSGAAVGRMIRLDQIRPNPDQPRKALGDLRELAESVREKGVLEPLGSLRAARGLLLHYLRRTPVPRGAHGGFARSTVHRENGRRRGDAGALPD